MELSLEKDRTNVLLATTALNRQCSILTDDKKDNVKIRNYLCPCGLVNTYEFEDKKVLKIYSKICDL